MLLLCSAVGAPPPSRQMLSVCLTQAGLETGPRSRRVEGVRDACSLIAARCNLACSPTAVHKYAHTHSCTWRNTSTKQNTQTQSNVEYTVKKMQSVCVCECVAEIRPCVTNTPELHTQCFVCLLVKNRVLMENIQQSFSNGLK